MTNFNPLIWIQLFPVIVPPERLRWTFTDTINRHNKNGNLSSRCMKLQLWKDTENSSGLCRLELIDVRIIPDWFEICGVCVQPSFPKGVITFTSYIYLTLLLRTAYSECNSIIFPSLSGLLFCIFFWFPDCCLRWVVSFVSVFVAWYLPEKLQYNCELHFPCVLAWQRTGVLHLMSL